MIVAGIQLTENTDLLGLRLVVLHLGTILIFWTILT